MFKRKWPWFGKLVSDEGFTISFGHKSAYYEDARGKFELGYEDGLLSATPHQVEGNVQPLSQADVDQMVGRVVDSIKFSGAEVEVFSSRRQQ